MASEVSSADQALLGLPAAELRARLASGAVSAVALTRACLARIAAVDAEVRAFTWIDPGFALHQAEALDKMRGTGRPIGALHGMPVALKDIIDTARIPTENGAALDKGRVPEADAFVVSRLKAAGAVIVGKTATTELAFLHPAPTTNPHNPAHTPGGSSSGSAAAVAAGMVPLAVGTQTGGSVIRPASFCGVTGFKPTFGAISRAGVLKQSQTLDTIGVFARDPEGAALLCDALFGHDPADPATAPAPHPQLLATAQSAPPLPPVFVFVQPPGWERAEPQTHAAFAELAAALGENQCFEAALPPIFNEAAAIRARINFAEMARNYARYARPGAPALSQETREAMTTGASVLAADYLSALEWGDVLYAGLSRIFERADAIIAPAALGPAPEGLGSTGDPIFNGLWTLMGVPAVTIPALSAENGLPMGVQLIGRRGDDARLLRTARWMMRWIDEQS